MKPYAELLEFNQPNQHRKKGFTRIRDAFPGLAELVHLPIDWNKDPYTAFYYDPERIVEFSGRWDYGEKNARRLGETVKVRRPVAPNDFGESLLEEQVDVSIIQKYIDMGHESMLEMADATFFIECSRVVSHELVRHRIASFQQESQRFVKYDAESADDMFYLPPEAVPFEGIFSYPDTYDEEGHVLEEAGDPGIPAKDAVTGLYDAALNTYQELRKAGVSPQIARYVLPNAMRTRLIMKTNLREWRHVVALRTHSSAQPEMIELMVQIKEQLEDIFPNCMYGVGEGPRIAR